MLHLRFPDGAKWELLQVRQLWRHERLLLTIGIFKVDRLVAIGYETRKWLPRKAFWPC